MAKLICRKCNVELEGDMFLSHTCKPHDCFDNLKVRKLVEAAKKVTEDKALVHGVYSGSVDRLRATLDDLEVKGE